MFITRRVALLLLAAFYCYPITSAQQAQPTSQESASSFYLDVVVASKKGAPVAGLSQQDFTLLDNGVPQSVTSFREVSRGEAPAEIILVVDAVNAKPDTVAYERTQVDKILRANGGMLAHPA